MIYIRGDTHGDPGEFTPEVMPGEDRWTKDDILLITGDFGFLLRDGEKHPRELEKLDTLARKPYTIAFVDGNHEGFPFLNACPTEVRWGAPVKRLRHNVFWLRRGYIYTIAGIRFFVMGGAYSPDKAFRLKYAHISGEAIWFPEELPCPEEYHRAIASLEAAGKKVDYILTHTAPRSIIPRLIHAMPDPHDAELTGFLDWVCHEVEFRGWYFGHFHEDLHLDDRLVAVFRQVHCLKA